MLRLFLGLSAAGQLSSEAVHTHYCGADRNIRKTLTNCHAKDGEAALGDSAVHITHCGNEGVTHQRHAALEVSVLEMLKKSGYGWAWKRQVTLFTRGSGNNTSKCWRSDITGFDNDGKMCVIDVTVLTLTAATYRGQRRSLRSRCIRALAEVVKQKKALPHARARVKDLHARHVIFALSSNGAFSKPARRLFNEVKQYVQEQGRTHMGISFRDMTTSFTTRFWGPYWQQRLCCALTGTSASRILRMLAADRLKADRIATNGKNVHTVVREYGRDGHDIPVAQSTNYSLEPHSSDDDSAPDLAHTSPDNGSHAATSGFWQDTQFDDPDFSADYNLLHSQVGARNAMDDPGGSVDDPGGGVIDDKGSFCDPSTSTLTSPKTSASFVTSSLTNRVSLLSLSDKSTVDMIGSTDYATGSFCSSCSIPPTLPGRFWLDGMGCAMCSYDYGG